MKNQFVTKLYIQVTTHIDNFFEMSFLSEMTTRRLATISRTARFTTVRTPRASFVTTSQLRKTPVVDAAKDTLKTVDRAVSDKLVDGINVASM